MNTTVLADGLNEKNLGGYLTITKTYVKDGRVEVVLDEQKNRLTTVGKLLMFSYLYSNRQTDPISKVAIGNGGTSDAQGRIPKVVNGSETDLWSPQVEIPVSYTVDNGNVAVVFYANLDEATGNNANYSEAGLKTAAGILFSIKTFVTVPKTSDFTLNFQWTLRYV